MKKITLFLSLLLLTGLFCTFGKAQEVFSVWDGTSASTSLSGSGTENDPLLIQSAADLRFLANQVNNKMSYLIQYIKLTVNIDLDNKAWTPIGKDVNNPFRGVFDGDGHVIKNLNVSGVSYAGLFGYASILSSNVPTPEGEIKNLHIESSNISGTVRVGGFVGYGTCHITNCSFSGTVTGSGECTGGIVGLTGYHAKIESCINTGTVTSSSGPVGGIAGGITSSLSNANGSTAANNSPIIISCMNVGDVSGNGTAGGIVGQVVKGSGSNFSIEILIKNNLNLGTVTGKSSKGGICGSDGWTPYTTFINNYSDKQMCPYLGINNKDAEGQAESKLTKEIIGSALRSSLGETDWSYTEGLYPYPTKFTNTDVIAIATTPVILFKLNNLNKVETDIYYGTANNVTATLANNSTATIGTGNGTITLLGNGSNVLTITKGIVNRKIAFNITMAPVFIGSNNTNTDWNTSSNWSNNKVPNNEELAVIRGNAKPSSDDATTIKDLYILKEGSVTIELGGNLRVTGEAENNGTLIIEYGGQFYCKSKGVKATVRTEIQAWSKGTSKRGDNTVGGWNFISSPVKDQKIEDMYGPAKSKVGANNDLFRYDEPQYLWVNYRDNDYSQAFGETKFTPGKGYLTAWEEETSLEFTGELNPSASIPASYRSTYQPLKGLNLIGNPFPHDIYLEVAANTSILETGYFTISDDGTLSANAFYEPIPNCYGVFVIATEEDNLVIKNTDEIPTKAKRSSGDLIIEVSNGEYKDKALISTSEGSKLRKINHLNETTPYLFIKEDGEERAITSADDNTESKTICLRVKKNGTYTITIKQDACSYQYLHLIDNLTGADIDLNQTDSYTFEAKKQDYDARFKLKLKDKLSESSAEENFTFVNNGYLIINSDESDATLQVIDIQGRILTSCKVSGHHEEPAPENAGLYIIRLIEGDKVKVQKITINK